MVEDHKYRKVVLYLKKGLKHKPYTHLKKNLLRHKWPEDIIDKAHNEILTNEDEILDILTSPVIKHNRKQYIEDLTIPRKETKKHFYQKQIERIKKENYTEETARFSLPGTQTPIIPEIQEEEEEYIPEKAPAKIKSYKYSDPYLESSKKIVSATPSKVISIDKTLENLEEQLKDFKDFKKEETYKNEIIIDPVDNVLQPVGDRAQTGIPGLDPVIQGGLRRNTVTLVAGGPGSGKTTLGIQYLINGIDTFKENGIYITFEQTRKDIYNIFDQNGWDLLKLEKENKLQILRLTPEQTLKILEAGGGTLRDAVESIHASRIVIDSISDLLMLFKADFSRRKFLIDLFELMNKLECTTVVIAEQETDPLKHASQVTEYQVDGVILLYNERIGDIRQRGLEIFKMRGTKHAGRIFPMKLSNQGVSIITNFKPKELPK